MLSSIPQYVRFWIFLPTTSIHCREFSKIRVWTNSYLIMCLVKMVCYCFSSSSSLSFQPCPHFLNIRSFSLLFIHLNFPSIRTFPVCQPRLATPHPHLRHLLVLELNSLTRPQKIMTNMSASCVPALLHLTWTTPHQIPPPTIIKANAGMTLLTQHWMLPLILHLLRQP